MEQQDLLVRTQKRLEGFKRVLLPNEGPGAAHNASWAQEWTKVGFPIACCPAKRSLLPLPHSLYNVTREVGGVLDFSDSPLANPFSEAGRPSTIA